MTIDVKIGANKNRTFLFIFKVFEEKHLHKMVCPLHGNKIYKPIPVRINFLTVFPKIDKMSDLWGVSLALWPT